MEISGAMITSIPKAGLPVQKPMQNPKTIPKTAEPRPLLRSQKFGGIEYSVENNWVKLRFSGGEKRRTKVAQLNDGRKFCVISIKGELVSILIEGDRLTQILSKYRSKRWKKG